MNHDKENEQNLSIPNRPTTEHNSAYIPNNPDFDPSKDVPQARGCDTMIDIISNSNN
jgi:hypothetical protein